MNSKRTIYSICLLLLMLSNASCNKWLDLKPLDGIVKDEYWKTKEDLHASVFACYSSLVGAPPRINDKAVGDRPVIGSLFYWGEVRADMLEDIPGTSVEQRDIADAMDVNIVQTSLLSQWSSIYRTINFCNLVIDNAETVRKNDRTLSTELMNAYVGEALTIRSLMYFYLVRTFRDVPLKLTATSSDSQITSTGKSTDKVVLDQLVSDLLKAESYLPYSHLNLSGTAALFPNEIDKGRVTKLAAQALLADVYLWMERYNDCETVCNKIIEYSISNPFQLGLVPSSTTWWNTVFGTGSSRETIFEFANQSSINNIFYALLAAPGKRFTASGKVIEEIFAPNTKDATLVDTRANAFFDPNNLTISKYGLESPSFVNWQVYRYSDILMMKAEALTFTERSGQALTIINELRAARNAQPSTETVIADPGDVLAVSRYILSERAREFAWEGKRWFDILRFAKRNNYKFDPDALYDIVASTVSPALQQNALAKYRDINSHYLPISESELFADKSLVQNPFYSK